MHSNINADTMQRCRLLQTLHDCFAHLTMLFNAIVVHGDLPDTFLYSTIVLIPKGRNVNLSDSSNYRDIALSN